MEKTSSGVIIKALEILEIFLKQRSELGISELADLAGLNVSTAHRIVSTLCNRRYLKQQGKRGKYTLGLKFLEFNSALKSTLRIRDVVIPFLRKLRTVSGESVNLAILESGYAVYIEHFPSEQYLLRAFTQVGNRVPLYCTGIGKVFLAYADEAELLSLTPKSFPKYTDNTIADIDELRKELLIIRREGVAVDNGEMDIGVRCVASPIKDSSGDVVAGISISGPSTRLDTDRINELKTLIRSYGLEISRSMGYKGG